MTTRVGINGFGRIGRSFTRLALDRADLEVVAVNDITDAGTLAHLLAFDSTYGRLGRTVEHTPDSMSIDGVPIAVLSERDPSAIDWGKLGADIVIESTGKFRTRDGAALHLKGGARKVLISAPGKGVDLTVVLGVNDADYEAFAAAAAGPMAGILMYSTDPIVSRDVIGDSASCVFDSPLTQASGTLVKVFGWYDNEWGYTCRLADLAALVGNRL